ncbi:MAG TPA: FAD-dependent oxidoreductase [Longimicrobiales bacterium]
MIERRPSDFARDRYDLLVVGGGVYGVALTLEAALRGLRPLLVERADFGGGTTWNSFRIIHGGLRYLQTLDLRRFRESVRERRWFLRHFPEVVRPFPFVMPISGKGMRRVPVLRAALRLNDLLSSRRNHGVESTHHIGGGRILGVPEALELVPGLDRRKLRGAALWYDGVMTCAPRVLIEMLHWACAAGARALNYVEAKRLLVEGTRVAGLEAVDRTNGETLVFRAPVVANCAGPDVRGLARRLDRDVPHLFSPSMAFNLLISRSAPSRFGVAVTADRPGARTYFVRPWGDWSFAGTCHVPASDEAAVHGPGPRDVEGMIADLNAGLPGWGVTTDDVRRVFWGVLPVATRGTVRLSTRPVLHDHARSGGPAGLFSVSGVKFTTARRVAEVLLAAILERVPGMRPGPVSPIERPEPAPVPTASEFRSLLQAEPAAARSLVARLMEREAVIAPDDLLLRRTDWGADPEQRDVFARELGSVLDARSHGPGAVEQPAAAGGAEGRA